VKAPIFRNSVTLVIDGSSKLYSWDRAFLILKWQIRFRRWEYSVADTILNA